MKKRRRFNLHIERPRYKLMSMTKTISGVLAEYKGASLMMLFILATYILFIKKRYI